MQFTKMVPTSTRWKNAITHRILWHTCLHESLIVNGKIGRQIYKTPMDWGGIIINFWKKRHKTSPWPQHFGLPFVGRPPPHVVFKHKTLVTAAVGLLALFGWRFLWEAEERLVNVTKQKKKRFLKSTNGGVWKTDSSFYSFQCLLDFLSFQPLDFQGIHAVDGRKNSCSQWNIVVRGYCHFWCVVACYFSKNLHQNTCFWRSTLHICLPVNHYIN